MNLALTRDIRESYKVSALPFILIAETYPLKLKDNKYKRITVNIEIQEIHNIYKVTCGISHVLFLCRKLKTIESAFKNYSLNVSSQDIIVTKIKTILLILVTYCIDKE